MWSNKLEQQKANHNCYFKHGSWIHGNNTYNERSNLASNSTCKYERNPNTFHNQLLW